MYELLAKYYDALVKDPEATKHWVDWIGVRGKTLLDCGCGSGEITHELSGNYQTTGIDLSPDMVREAKAKYDLDFEVRDMTDLEGLGTFDVITCLCDSFNYLDKEQAEEFFDECARHLNDSGWLLFDTHSLDRLDEFADGYVEAGQFEDGTQVQWSIESEDNEIYQDFVFYLPDGRLIQEHHLQWVYTPEELEEMLEKNFEVCDITTDFDVPGITSGEKYFYVCRKKGTVAQ